MEIFYLSFFSTIIFNYLIFNYLIFNSFYFPNNNLEKKSTIFHLFKNNQIIINNNNIQIFNKLAINTGFTKYLMIFMMKDKIFRFHISKRFFCSFSSISILSSAGKFSSPSNDFKQHSSGLVQLSSTSS